jgi:hypothetical protein
MLSGKQGVDAVTVENPNVKSIWTTIEVDKDGVETVLVRRDKGSSAATDSPDPLTEWARFPR